MFHFTNEELRDIQFPQIENRLCSLFSPRFGTLSEVRAQIKAWFEAEGD